MAFVSSGHGFALPKACRSMWQSRTLLVLTQDLPPWNKPARSCTQMQMAENGTLGTECFRVPGPFFVTVCLCRSPMAVEFLAARTLHSFIVFGVEMKGTEALDDRILICKLKNQSRTQKETAKRPLYCFIFQMLLLIRTNYLSDSFIRRMLLWSAIIYDGHPLFAEISTFPEVKLEVFPSH